MLLLYLLCFCPITDVAGKIDASLNLSFSKLWPSVFDNWTIQHEFTCLHFLYQTIYLIICNTVTNLILWPVYVLRALIMIEICKKT